MNRLFSLLAALILAAFCAGARQPEQGYRGFVESSNSVRRERYGIIVPDFSYKETEFRTGLSTSHGYQFNPWLFVGAGVEYQRAIEQGTDYLAPFAHVRTDQLFGRFSPFASLRLGYNLTNDGGIYFSPEIGYRFNWGRKVGLNVGAGLTLEGYKLYMFDAAIAPDGYLTAYKAWTERRCHVYFTFRVGIDF